MAHETFTASSKNGVFYFGVSASASIYDQLPANLRYVQLTKKSAESGEALAGAVFQVEYSTDGGTTWEPYDNGNAVTTNASG